MKKLLLGTTLLSVFALASCAGSASESNDFKRCDYLSVANLVYVNEYGSARECKMVSTYIFDDESLSDLESWFYNFPPSISIMKTYTVPANGQVNVIPPEPAYSIQFNAYIVVSGVTEVHSFTLNLVEDSSVVYETTHEYYYSESTKTIKEVIHKDLRTTDSTYSYEAAYYTGDSYFVLKSEAQSYPTTEYNFVTPLYDIKEETFERYTDVGIYPVAYSFVEE